MPDSEWMIRVLVPTEIRSAFLEVSREALGAIVRDETMELEAVFFFDRVHQRLMRVADHGAFHVAKCQRRTGSDRFRQLPRFRFKGRLGKNAGYNSKSPRLLRRNLLRGVKQFRSAR